MALCEEMFSAGVYIVPSTALLGKEPGWFRITFTMKRPLLDEGMSLSFYRMKFVPPQTKFGAR